MSHFKITLFHKHFSSAYYVQDVVLSHFIHIQFSSVTQLCPTFCDPMDCSMPGFPVLHQLSELTQTHVHWVGDAISMPVGDTIQHSHSLPSPSSPALNLSQHQGLFKGVSSSHQVAKVLGFQLHPVFCTMSRNSFHSSSGTLSIRSRPLNLFLTSTV